MSPLVQIGKLHELTRLLLRQLMVSASSSVECSYLVVVMPVIVVSPVEKIHSERLALPMYHHIPMKAPHCSSDQLHLGVVHL